jgi:hypothetical protein
MNPFAGDAATVRERREDCHCNAASEKTIEVSPQYFDGHQTKNVSWIRVVE